LLTSRQWIATVACEHFLVFQAHTLLLQPASAWFDRYRRYSFVGAPWLKYSDMPELGGNGGLSLRRKSVMLPLARGPDDNEGARSCTTAELFRGACAASASGDYTQECAEDGLEPEDST
jgi:hypothetical protein